MTKQEFRMMFEEYERARDEALASKRHHFSMSGNFADEPARAYEVVMRKYGFGLEDKAQR